MTTKTKIAVIGSGNMGSGIARALAAAGLEVLIGARDAAKARGLADAPGSSMQVVGVAGAVAAADVVVLALPYSASVEVLSGLPAAALDGKVLVDISNPVTADFQGLQLGTTTSAAEAIQAAAPQAHVVKAFNTIFAQLLATDARQGKVVQVLVAGDDADAKARVQALAGAMGFEPVDAGPLRNSRFLEPVGGMNIQFGFFLGWGPAAAPAWVRL